MAAKSKLSLAVQKICTGDRDNSLRLVTAFAVDIYVLSANGFETKGYAADVFAEFPHRTLATWANYASAAKALNDGKNSSAKLAGLAASCSEEEAIEAMAVWLTAELRKGTYGQVPDEISSFAHGRLSRKAREKALKRAEQEQAQAEPAPVAQAEPAPVAQAEPAPVVLVQFMSDGALTVADIATVADLQVLVKTLNLEIKAMKAAQAATV